MGCPALVNHWSPRMKLIPVLLALHLIPGVAWSDSLLPADALRYLIDRKETGPANSGQMQKNESTRTPAPSHSARGTEALRPNETLDGLIKRTWPGLPSKETGSEKRLWN